ncbi:hypothetical protein TcYC6_0029170 [Trypanosoma cruzi]|nr:hypothetical protein TcYC6_0029170 [Trypanosoma cruzi]
MSNCRVKAAEVHRVDAGAGRWAHAEGGGLQAVATSSDRRSHGKVWRTKKATPPARPLQAWWMSLQPTSPVAGHSAACTPGEVRCLAGAAPVEQQGQS